MSEAATEPAPEATAFGFDQKKLADAFEGIRKSTEGIARGLPKAIEPLTKVSKEIGSSKFKKNTKQFSGAMKGMGKAAIQAWKMEQLMKLIQPFLDLLQLAEIPINTLSGLLKILTAEIFKDLITHVITLTQDMIALAPYFRWLGDKLGDVLEVGLLKLVVGLQDLYVILLPLFKEIGERGGPIILALWEGMKLFFGWMSVTFEPFWTALKTTFQSVKTAWDNNGGVLFGPDGLLRKGFERIKTAWDNTGGLLFGETGIIETALSNIDKIWEESGGKVFGPDGAIALHFGELKHIWNSTGALIFGPNGFIQQAFGESLDAVKVIFNSMVLSINNFIDEINEFFDVDIPKIPTFIIEANTIDFSQADRVDENVANINFKDLDVQRMAEGGIVTSPTLALLGDNASGVEQVTPLEKAGNLGFGGDPEVLSAIEEQNELMRQILAKLMRQEDFRRF